MQQNPAQAHHHITTRILFICTFILCTLSMSGVIADEQLAPIPMQAKGAATYYIKGNIRGLGSTEFMVDTGSGYVTINEHTLAQLKSKGEAIYVKDLMGVLADGQRKVFPVYRIASIRLGNHCELRDVEAAVFPGRTRQILGLSALRKAGAFTFSFDPPQLTLSTCANVS
jgi:predicted aspartyl protease